RNANLVILNSPEGDEYDALIAEARFLRAFSYFQLVRNWGDVPLRTEETMNDKDLARSPQQEVYQLIQTDLTEAANTLAENASVSGRPTKWAAKTLLADVYLQLGKYAEAAENSLEVTQGNYTLVNVSDKEDFQYRVFGPDIISSTEEIFALKYARLPNQGNYIL